MAAESPSAPQGAGRWRATLTVWPSRLLMSLVRGYRLLLKPWLGNACRFEPSCSAYTLEALERHGASGGMLLGGWRLLRCQPWCQGGCDPVPDHHPLRGLFTRWVAPASASPDLPAGFEAPVSTPGRPLPARSPSSSRQSRP